MSSTRCFRTSSSASPTSSPSSRSMPPRTRGALRLPLSKEARLRAGLPLEETDAEMLQRVYKPDKENCPYITMVTLSCSPAGSNDDDCVALCVYRRGRCLAIARPGDALWTRVEVGWEYMVSTASTSAWSTSNGGFYAACYDGTQQCVVVPAAGGEVCGQAVQGILILVEIAVVARRRRLVFVGTESCLSPWDDDRYLCAFRWDHELRSFGGRALFLSAGTAFFADARILPWCAGDCIYHIDDESVLAGMNMTVRCYNMRSRKYRWPSGRHGPGTAVLRPESIGPTRPDQHQKHRPRHGLI
uniref:KIB1-4 beta-propeller domain-containing protein n=1 Tax=Oryza rufipogon TaxID=4529 RepID=A0A0E0Q4X0_ORYRU